MLWANTSAVAVWNADSLETLVTRDFSKDMSEVNALGGQSQALSSWRENIRTGKVSAVRKSAHIQIRLGARLLTCGFSLCSSIPTIQQPSQ
jgi:hypothetical protein